MTRFVVEMASYAVWKFFTVIFTQGLWQYKRPSKGQNSMLRYYKTATFQHRERDVLYSGCEVYDSDSVSILAYSSYEVDILIDNS